MTATVDAPEVGFLFHGGNRSFDDELLGLDRALGVYVIVRELLHFSVPNHGRLRKSLMRAHLGDYEQIAKRLTQRQRSTEPFPEG